MSAFSEINDALIKAVAAMSVGLPIAYENVQYDPQGAPYVRMTVIPAVTEYSTLGMSGCDYHEGILQLDVFYPVNQGITDILTKADLINAYFYPARVFPETTLNVRIEQCSIERRIVTDGWCMQPISIEYYAYSPRVEA